MASDASSRNHQLDVIIRLHDISRGFELRRSLFSVVCQSYRPLIAHIVTQRFSEADIHNLQSALESTWAIDPATGLRFWNYTEREPVDARSALINLGLANATGRYIAFLDHDDTIYPDAYQKLVTELQQHHAAIAFGRIVAKELDAFQDALIVNKRQLRFTGNGLLELFRDNFCPLHSFVIDRQQIEPMDMRFDETLSRLEDYEFLLRICAKYPASFQCMATCVGDYYFKNDGSNTTCLIPNRSGGRRDAWELARKRIQARRKSIVLSPTVQRLLGVCPADPNLTIERVLESFQSATS